MKSIRWFAALLLVAAAHAMAAVPTVEAVQAEIQAGHYDRAEQMMQEVVTARPKSAKAHYIYAEVLAHNRRFEDAAREARSAREIDPSLSFTDAARFRSFEQTLERERAAALAPRTSGTQDRRSVDGSATAPVAPPAAPRTAPDRGTPSWLWIGGLAVGMLVLWRLLSRRTRAGVGAAGTTMSGPAAANWNPTPGPGMPGSGGYPYPVPPGGVRQGPGWLGAGAAAAGGVAAGMLAERMLHRDPSLPPEVAPAGPLATGFDEDAIARELEQRPVDFGTGNDWGGDAGDVGGSDNGGGGGSDDW